MLTIENIKQRIKDTHGFYIADGQKRYFNNYENEKDFILAEYYITILALLETNMSEAYFSKQLDKDGLTVLQKETINFVLTSNVDIAVITKHFKPTKKYK